MCLKTQAVRGFACALFEAVNRASDIWELRVSRRSSSTESRGSESSRMSRMIQELSTESQVEKLGIEVAIAWPLCKVL